MSRSTRHTPICGNASARSDRPWKRIWHRGYRHRTQQQVRQGLDPVPIRGYGAASIYLSNKDGKHWFGQYPWSLYGYWLERLGSTEAYEAWHHDMTRKMMRK